ncbi:MAG: hypothetical protein ACR2JB_21725 [Bryobacteraceae bacterium]
MNRHGMKISMFATHLMIVCGLLVSGASAIAQADDQHCSCSNRTLSGDYGSVAQGVLLPNPGLPPELPFTSVGVTHFDGKGNFKGSEHTVVNGTAQEVHDVDWTPNSGTYTVNLDCTGKIVLNTPNSLVPLNIFFVIVRHGTEFRSILGDHGALASTWIKVGETPR